MFSNSAEKQPLEEKHLFPIETSNQAERLTADLEREWLAEERASEQNRTQPRLWRAMVRIIPCREFLTWALLRILYSLASNFLPLIVWFFLRSISTASELSYTTTLPFVLGIALTNGLRTICTSHVVFKVEMMKRNVFHPLPRLHRFKYLRLVLHKLRFCRIYFNHGSSHHRNTTETISVFALLSALSNIRLAVTLHIAHALRLLADAKTACARMQRGRKYKSRSVRIEGFRSGEPTLISARKLEATSQHIPSQIVLERVSCFWSQRLECPTLKNVSLVATNGQLVGITGPVGSGKTSLLMTILEELPVSSGQISCIGKISYVPQTHWVFSGTLRDNILFGRDFDQLKYHHIIEACDLAVDIARFPKGDLTEIGQRGVILSGGQRARVCLARAIYSDADIYLLDDPLSAVDSKVGKHLFDRCIKEFLAGRIRILVTHQLHVLKHTNSVIMLENGSVVYEGAYSGMEIVRSNENQSNGTKRIKNSCSTMQKTSPNKKPQLLVNPLPLKSRMKE
ncbi:hypothetical protein OS493_028642 [Desmophyllum pertusum]|uniref:ABC transporter domain-containing protein n=1 Tax=Desmophyllum pertusum TaxID=174260 RepID=A0A9W9YKD8_9CNID|nr:hypothetical protein OS493_028642 [Desmophyllum pertusum]